MPDRDAAPAAAEGADYWGYWGVYLPESRIPDEPVALFRYSDHADRWARASYPGRHELRANKVARPAPAAELKPGAENFNSDGGDEGDFNSPAPAAAPREGGGKAIAVIESWLNDDEPAEGDAEFFACLRRVLSLARSAAAPREGEPKHHGPHPDVSPSACVKCGEPWPCPEWTRECEAIIDRVGAKHDAADVAWKAYPRDSDSYKATYKDGFGAGWDAAAREAARGEG